MCYALLDINLQYEFLDPSSRIEYESDAAFVFAISSDRKFFTTTNSTALAGEREYVGTTAAGLVSQA